MKPKSTQFLHFVWNFYQATMYQKSEWYFFDQGSIDGKSEVGLEKYHLVAELKLNMLNMHKVTFSILTPPTAGAFELLLHFSYLWNIAQKCIIQIFDTLSINNFHWNFPQCIVLVCIQLGVLLHMWPAHSSCIHSYLWSRWVNICLSNNSLCTVYQVSLTLP